MTKRSERAPWGDFPSIIRNGDLGELKAQPEYLAAKAGDKVAGLEIAQRLLRDDIIGEIRAQLGDRKPKILPVIAMEATGKNSIPLAFAALIAHKLGLELELGIGQVERVFRTDSGSDHRLVYNPRFSGEVEPGADYLIVDDTLTMGGTLASLRGYLENRGGHVVAGFAAVAHEGAVSLPIKTGMLTGIKARHGDAMNEMWIEEFGYGIDQLTQGEAGHVKKAASVEAMRVRIHDARSQAGWAMDAGRTGAASGTRQFPAIGRELKEALQSPALSTGKWPELRSLAGKLKCDKDSPEP